MYYLCYLYLLTYTGVPPSTVLEVVHVLFILFVFIYVYWCPTRFPYQMMFVSFNTNTTGVTCGSETSDIFRGTRCSCCSTFSFLCSALWVVCLSLCTFSLAYCVFSSSIYASDYLFDIYKRFLYVCVLVFV